MIAVVEAIASQRCQIDASHERDLTVDYHELLVVAVHRALANVERALNAGSTDELVTHPTHRRA